MAAERAGHERNPVIFDTTESWAADQDEGQTQGCEAKDRGKKRDSSVFSGKIKKLWRLEGD